MPSKFAEIANFRSCVLPRSRACRPPLARGFTKARFPRFSLSWGTP